MVTGDTALVQYWETVCMLRISVVIVVIFFFLWKLLLNLILLLKKVMFYTSYLSCWHKVCLVVNPANPVNCMSQTLLLQTPTPGSYLIKISYLYTEFCQLGFLALNQWVKKSAAFRTLIDLCMLAIKYVMYHSSFKVPSQLYWDFHPAHKVGLTGPGFNSGRRPSKWLDCLFHVR